MTLRHPVVSALLRYQCAGICMVICIPVFLRGKLARWYVHGIAFSLRRRQRADVCMVVCIVCAWMYVLSVLPCVIDMKCAMGWLQLLGSIKFQVSFAKEPYKIEKI